MENLKPKPEDFGLSPEFLTQFKQERDLLSQKIKDLKIAPLRFWHKILLGVVMIILWVVTSAVILTCFSKYNIDPVILIVCFVASFFVTSVYGEEYIIKYRIKNILNSSDIFKEGKNKTALYKKALSEHEEKIKRMKYNKHIDRMTTYFSLIKDAFSCSLEDLGFHVTWRKVEPYDIIAILDGHSYLFRVDVSSNESTKQDVVNLNMLMMYASSLSGVILVNPAGCTKDAKNILQHTRVSFLNRRHLDTLASPNIPDTLKILFLTGALGADFFDGIEELWTTPANRSLQN